MSATTTAHGAHAAHAAHAAATIVLPHIRYLAILPELVMLGGAVALLGVSALVRGPLRTTVATVATVAVSLTSFGFAWWQWVDVQDHGPYTAIAHAVVVDGFSAFVAILVSAAMALSALVGDAYVRREATSGVEMHVLAMVSASGAMIMGAANDLVLVFLGLEILSIALYVLTALNHRRAASGEAALKYFVLGGFSSAIFVYGIALTYGATGTTNLTQIADFLSKNVIVSDGVLLAGLSLLLVGFAFKVAAVPFHMWTPDVYQGSPSPITGFMAAVAKVGGFAALLRVFVSSFGVLRADWQPVIYAVAVLTLLLGAGLAVVQRDIKRMLAYSSINHAGFILLGLQAANAAGVSGALYYLFTYTFMVIGSFAVITLLGRRGDASHDIAGYRGLASRQPLLAFAFAVLLLAQAGVPFTTGFLAKLQVVSAAVDVHSVPLAVIAMVSAALAAFFYLRVAVLMYTPPVRPATLGAGEEAPAGSLGAFGSVPPESGGVVVDAGRSVSPSVVGRMNAGLLLDDAPVATVEDDLIGGEAEDPASIVKVPVTVVVVVAVCLAVTIVFGIVPAPIVDFAHKATLLFLP